jgi:uncharacterized protein (DUF362 family)
MKRRSFIKGSVAAGIGGALAAGVGNDALGAAGGGKVDMVGVKGGEPAEMFDKAMAELGGMGKFVKRGQSVVVKPNIGWSRTPESGADTNPDLVKRVVEHCLKAGAKTVHIFDHTCNSWRDCYEKSGMNDVAESTGAKLVTGNHSNDYRDIDIPNGKRLKKAKIHRLILDSDVFINVPVIKNHGGAVMTCGMKNLMGIVWDRGYFHKNNLQQCIADFVTVCKPDLNVIDGYRVMKKGGPRGHNLRDVETMKYLIVTTDIVAGDTAASKVIGIPTERIHHIRMGEELDLGTMSLNRLKIKRIDLTKES